MKASSSNDIFCIDSNSDQLYQKKYHLPMSTKLNQLTQFM